MAFYDFLYLKNYEILSHLKPEFIKNLKTINIFGSNGNQVLIQTIDGKVYAFGDNENGCLGLSGDQLLYEEPVIVEELCYKSLTDLCFGENHVIVLTKTGDVFSWGSNNFGQLGNGSTIDSFKPQLIPELIDKTIVEMSCGSDHSLVLTKKGDVFAFGHNNFGQIGNNSNHNQLIPILVNGFDGEKVIAISCGVYHSLALTETGRVFSWGNNFYHQLGVDSIGVSDQLTPIWVKTNHNIIQKISCGSYHNLLLTIDGEIYAFGYNNCGQIGNGRSRGDELSPVRVDSNLRFADIASHCFISVAITRSNTRSKGFVWGQFGKSSAHSPKESFPSIETIFAIHSVPNITYKTIHLNDRKPFILSGSQISSFNEELESDLKIKIDDNYIYVQKSILESRCEYFSSYLSKNWSNDSKDVIEIKFYTFPVYYAFIRYLYTNCVEISKTEDVIELLELADFYCEEELKQKCIQLLRSLVSIENVCTLYLTSIYHNFRKLKEFCFLFALKNFQKVRKTQGFKQMDNNLQKNLIDGFNKLSNFSNN